MTQKTKRSFLSTVVFAGALALASIMKAQTPPTEVVLHHFGGLDGSQPVGGVTGDWKGNLYGTTVLGGTAGFGVVYKIDSTGMETVLHSFTDGLAGPRHMAG